MPFLSLEDVEIIEMGRKKTKVYQGILREAVVKQSILIFQFHNSEL
jgi:hypothetical protein